jgi:hypothetical protein
MRSEAEGVSQLTQILISVIEASKAQSEDLAQVNHAIAHMDAMTQQNAALVKEAAAAAESLQRQAIATVAAVNQLKPKTHGVDWSPNTMHGASIVPPLGGVVNKQSKRREARTGDGTPARPPPTRRFSCCCRPDRR